MKLQYCSDLHLEFPENRDFMEINPLVPKGEILILAGDIVPFRIMEEHSLFFDRISKDFETTYWLPGNHEYYHSDIKERTGVLNEKIRENIFLVNDISVPVGDTDFIFTTLWTRISEKNSFRVKQGLSDFHAIKNGKRGLSPDEYNTLHNQAVDFLTSELRKSQGRKKVVVSHHVPTMMNYPEMYKGDVLNEAFAVELYDLIERSNAYCWIYGHHHVNVNGFYIGGTRLVTNQLGYVKFGENKKFMNTDFIEI